MSKKCKNCDLVCFASDEACKRCGSPDFADSDSNFVPKTISFWTYLCCFLLALVFEVVAILPALGSLGFSKSGTGLSAILFLLHLPSSAVTLLLLNLTGNPLPLLLTPLLQIIFWTSYLIYRLRKKLKTAV
jgi:hypothetical protein